MAALVAVLAVLFVRIHVADVRWRIVRISNLLLLGAVRLAALAVVTFAPAFSLSVGLVPARWGLVAFGVQVCCAAVIVLVIELLAQAVGKLTRTDTPLGQGDVLLYAACCLLVRPESILAFLLLSSAVGAVFALYQKARGQATFPFAPAIVWPCLLFVAL